MSSIAYGMADELTMEPAIETRTVEVMERRLDAAVAGSFEQAMIGDMAMLKTRRLALDMRRVEFMDTTGLGALVAILKSMGTGGYLQLDHVKPTVMTMLRLTRMDQIFKVRAELPTRT